MLTISAFGVSACLLGYLLTLLIGNVLNVKNDVLASYQIKKDPYIYIFLLLFVAFFGICLFMPDFKDAILPINYRWLLTSFLFAAFIYILYLIEADKLLDFGVLFFAVLNTFLFADRQVLVDLAPVPWQLSALGIGLIIGLTTLGARILVGLTGVFSLVFSLLSFGLFLIAAAGGIPLYLGLMAATMLGVFACIFQFNRWGMQLKINEGAMMSACFLFCMLLLAGTNELAGPSVFILCFYILTELLWSLCNQYILRRKENDLYFNTVYFHAFEKGLELGTVHILILKICVINIVLAIFELYAQNAFTLPILAFVINFWFLSKMYNAGQEQQSFKEINKNFVENLKSEIKDIKQTFNKKD